MNRFSIPIEIMAETCPYWDYANHISNYTCNSCKCMTEGNTINTIQLGIRIGKDRYCTINTDIHVSLRGILNILNR